MRRLKKIRFRSFRVCKKGADHADGSSSLLASDTVAHVVTATGATELGTQDRECHYVGPLMATQSHARVSALRPSASAGGDVVAATATAARGGECAGQSVRDQETWARRADMGTTRVSHLTRRLSWKRPIICRLDKPPEERCQHASVSPGLGSVPFEARKWGGCSRRRMIALLLVSRTRALGRAAVFMTSYAKERGRWRRGGAARWP